MTDRYYGADLGASTHDDVTEDTSTTSKAIELRVTYTTTGLNKLQLLNALEALEARIKKDNWPPA